MVYMRYVLILGIVGGETTVVAGCVQESRPGELDTYLDSKNQKPNNWILTFINIKKDQTTQ